MLMWPIVMWLSSNSTRASSQAQVALTALIWRSIQPGDCSVAGLITSMRGQARVDIHRRALKTQRRPALRARTVKQLDLHAGRRDTQIGERRAWTIVAPAWNATERLASRVFVGVDLSECSIEILSRATPHLLRMATDRRVKMYMLSLLRRPSRPPSKHDRRAMAGRGGRPGPLSERLCAKATEMSRNHTQIRPTRLLGKPLGGRAKCQSFGSGSRAHGRCYGEGAAKRFRGTILTLRERPSFPFARCRHGRRRFRAKPT